MELRLQPLLLQLRVDLRPHAVHQHQLDTEAVQQGEVVKQMVEIRAQRGLAAETDDAHTAVVRVRVRCNGAQGAHKIIRRHGAYCVLKRLWARNRSGSGT